jgi:hypothetical protein
MPMNPLRRSRVGSAARRERGATTVVTAVLLLPVLLGCLALSFDVGQLMWERRQLQNGADAAVVLAAKTCSKTPALCPTGGNALGTDPVSQLASQNANDQKTNVLANAICGNATARSLAPSLLVNPECSSSLTPTAPQGTTQCAPRPANLPAGVPYIELTTTTKTSGGTGIASRVFSAANNTDRKTTVAACARAAWGSPGSSTPLAPLTVSGCDWQHATGGTSGGGGGAYYPPPVYTAANPKGYGTGNPWPAAFAAPPTQNPGGEVVLLVQNPPGGHLTATPCPTWQGHALPGGFGVLETISSSACEAKQYPFNWFHTDPGSSVACNLSTLVGTVINLPVYDCTHSSLPGSAAIPPAGGDCTMGTGSNSYYHMQGWAAFYLSGYSVTTSGGIPNRIRSVNPNVPNPGWPCGSSESCISGWFTSGTLNATTIAGPPGGPGSFGTTTVVSAG